MECRPRFPSLKGIAFDLDGTIYLGQSAIDGAVETLAFLREQGLMVFYFTNASGRTREQVRQKLVGLGLEADLRQVYTSGFACAQYACAASLGEVFCIGTQGLRDELGSRGISVTEDGRSAQAVIVGLDPGFSYDRLAEAGPMIGGDCRLIVCNRDRSFPVEGGRLLPGCGPIVAAVESFFGREADYMAGKPNTFMMELLCQDWGLNKDEIAVVGDSFTSDMEMARRFGCASILIAEEKPAVTFDQMQVVRDIRELKDVLFTSC
ncbi:HAD-IIA family hydrolase [Geomonas terrae]|uniref:HAD-IIA family hydrolase n=1 Tax=Geomonas terrae TaxID=2562681 RepID=A0A4S1C9V8_9BACT|nr:HAD-IIA family hydrolase [Geomonas terrae]TGU70049.1 HAD-IIA family hydrolase [Geomonas terrae]